MVAHPGGHVSPGPTHFGFMASVGNEIGAVRAEPNPYLVLLTVSTCTALYSMTVTVVNVVLPQLQGALSATPDQVSWIVTLNVVGTAVVTPAVEHRDLVIPANEDQVYACDQRMRGLSVV